MTPEEEKAPASAANPEPDIGFLRNSRGKLLRADRRLDGLEAILREDPDLARDIEFYNGLGNYLGDLDPYPAADEYCRNFYQFQILIDTSLTRKIGLANAAQLAVVFKDLKDLQTQTTTQVLPALEEVKEIVDKEPQDFEALKESVQSLRTRLEVLIPLQTTVITAAIGALGTTLTAALGAQITTILEAIEAATATLEAGLNALPDKIYERFKEGIPVDSEAISDQVALKIVGESYYEWNSVSSFYPTVTFIFREVNVTTRPKQTQVKT